MKFNFWVVLVILASLSPAEAREDQQYELLGKNATEIISLRGYTAEEHQVVVRGGYILNLVRATNPLVNEGKRGSSDRSVVLFVHGTQATAKNFLLFTGGASPSDHSDLNASQMDTSELLETLRENNSSHSLALTLLDFGHEVWLLNRRGNFYSQGNIYKHKQAHLGPKTDESSLGQEVRAFQEAIQNLSNVSLAEDKFGAIFSGLPQPIINMNNLKLIPNPKYWNFTTDDVVKYDMPAVVNYVLKFTGRKRLAYVGHSLGGALILNALSLNRNLNDKFTKILLWSPALDIQAGRRNNMVLALVSFLELPLKLYKGDIPPEVLLPYMQNLGAFLCSSEQLKERLCDAAIESLNGPGADQLDMVAGHWTDQFSVSAASELGQLAQDARTFRSSMFDYGPYNLARYGQPLPPIYNVSTITTESLTIFSSQFDTLVSPSAVRRMSADLRVPFEFVLFNDTNYYPSLKFNHIGYLLHRNITSLIVEPSLRAIQAAGAE